MSARQGPVRTARNRSNRTPYARPPPRPSLFTRLKNYIWGETPAPAIGEAQIIPEESQHSIYQDPSDQLSNSSRITYTSDVQTAPSTFIQQDAPNLNSTLSGPNETLRQFFEAKGDGELSNMEIVGVLSLIGQAVARDESVVDFSTISNLSNLSIPSQFEQSQSSLVRTPSVLSPQPRKESSNLFFSPRPPRSVRKHPYSRANHERNQSFNQSRLSAQAQLRQSNKPTPNASISNVQKPLFADLKPRKPVLSKDAKPNLTDLYASNTSSNISNQFTEDFDLGLDDLTNQEVKISTKAKSNIAPPPIPKVSLNQLRKRAAEGPEIDLNSGSKPEESEQEEQQQEEQQQQQEQQQEKQLPQKPQQTSLVNPLNPKLAPLPEAPAKPQPELSIPAKFTAPQPQPPQLKESKDPVQLKESNPIEKVEEVPENEFDFSVVLPPAEAPKLTSEDELKLQEYEKQFVF